jgi:N-acetylneuraminic acid mutarotase
LALPPFVIGNKGYAGLGGSSPDIVKKDFWEYDPATNKWTAKADFTGKERVFSSQFAIGTDGYVGLGTTPPHRQTIGINTIPLRIAG